MPEPGPATARVTVEDCLPQIANPFDLTMLAAERARQLNEGASLQVEPVAGTARDSASEGDDELGAEDRAA